MIFPLRERGLIADMEEFQDSFHGDGAVKKDRNPVDYIHVIRRHDAVFVSNHVVKDHIVDLKIHTGDGRFSRKAEKLSSHLHDQGEPLPVLSVAEDRAGTVAIPGEFRVHAILVGDIFRYLITLIGSHYIALINAMKNDRSAL